MLPKWNVKVSDNQNELNGHGKKGVNESKGLSNRVLTILNLAVWGGKGNQVQERRGSEAFLAATNLSRVSVRHRCEMTI